MRVNPSLVLSQTIGGLILEKPVDKQDAYRMLSRWVQTVVPLGTALGQDWGRARTWGTSGPGTGLGLRMEWIMSGWHQVLRLGSQAGRAPRVGTMSTVGSGPQVRALGRDCLWGRLQVQ